MDEFEKYRPKLEAVSAGKVIVSVAGGLSDAGALVLAMSTKDGQLGTYSFSVRATDEIRHLLKC